MYTYIFIYTYFRNEFTPVPPVPIHPHRPLPCLPPFHISTSLFPMVRTLASNNINTFTLFSKTYNRSKTILEDFPGGAVVKNPPANAGDKGSSPRPGRSHMSRSN